MESMEYHGIIVRQLRMQAKLTVQQAAKVFGRSSGWLCEIENGSGRCRLLPSEFDRIVELLDGENQRPLFKTWVANYNNAARVDKTYDGAVLKYIRQKKNLNLKQASDLLGLSFGYLSKLELGIKPLKLEMRNRVMIAYGYSPSSFKNLSTDPVRSRAVPSRLKFEILMQNISDQQADEIFQQVLEKFKNNHLK